MGECAGYSTFEVKKKCDGMAKMDHDFDNFT